MISVLHQLLSELQAVRKSIEGLRRDLKRRDARDQQEQAPDLVVLAHPPQRTGKARR